MNDHDTQVIQALTLSPEEIVQNGIHFTDIEANIISIRRVSKHSSEACERLLQSDMFDEPSKKWWEFWK